jgi:FkbM family methyltransferase
MIAEVRFLRMKPTRLPKLRQCETNGFSILVNVNEDVGRSIYLNDDFEREEVRFLESNVRPGDTCFDVGANIGYFSLLMAKLAPNGTIHSIEPVPFNFQLLNTNVQLNRFSNIQPRPLAVSNHTGTAEFTVATDGAYSSFLDTKRKPIESRIVVETISLDEYCDQNSITRIDCLKVDVEGAEGKVLAGAARLLSNPARRPRFIVIELYSPMLAQYGCDIQEIVVLLRGYGYEAYVERGGKLTTFTLSDHDILYNVFFLNTAKTESLNLA